MILNRNQLKYIAAAAMLLDHTAYLFNAVLPPVLYTVMRLIGRLTAPIMCFFLVEGFLHTRSKGKYVLRLSAFAVAAQPCFLLMCNEPWTALHFNMLFTLLLCFLIMLVIDKLPLPASIPLAMVLILLCRLCDWGSAAPFWVLALYLTRRHEKLRLPVFCAVAALLIAVEFIISSFSSWQLVQCGVFMAVPLLYLYDGTPGSRKPFHKWFFYVFYPAHIFLLWLLTLL